MSHLHFTTSGTLATLTFDRENSRANLFDRATLLELRDHLEAIADLPDLTALLIRSAKPNIFIAGADLDTLAHAKGDDLLDLITLGQETFNLLADLKIPTVAAIDGACVGGGLELALACDWRVASDSPKTKIGLPETQLGILPAWGGSTRLPALIGLPKALPLILSGKLLTAPSASRHGIVDAVVPAELLESFALTLHARSKRRLRKRPLIHNKITTGLIRKRAAASLAKKTRNLYPGPLAALEVVCDSVLTTREQSLHNERTAILRLAPLPQTRQLLRLFFLTESAKKRKIPGTEPHHVHHTAVIGSGVMGSGIAYWLSTRGLPVILQDLQDDALAKGMHRISKLYADARQRHVLDPTAATRGLDRIHPASHPVPLQRCDLVIEAAVEQLEIKKKIFADLAKRTSPDCVLATNTSALPIHALAEVVPFPERLLGLHFFNPVHRMQLVEVVRTDTTSDATLATGIAFVQRIGKMPVVVKDSPGFLVNRILMPYLVEAARLFEQGTDPAAIDRAMLDFGMPMGPLRLLDEVGLDVALHVARTLSATFPDRMHVPGIVEKLVEKGHLGRKSGSGFYLYPKNKPNPAALRLSKRKIPDPADLQQQLALLMTEEAQRCLDEKIAESADDIDLAMILGTGFAPFRGGPLADTTPPTP
ncbi:MAG: 3-hydroxyacyl-CoA dehydrogenase NAD-binding domain-containing protein [Luteolibacter sp.]